MAPERQQTRASTLTRRWSLNASVRRAALEEDHAIALEQFRARIASAGRGLPPQLLINGDLEATLLRFLRARKWHVEHAYAMLEKSLGWRRQMSADVILEQEPDARIIQLVRECRPSSYIGFDDKHHPIFLERLGKLDGKRFEREGVSDEAVLGYHLREMEFMAQVVMAEASAAAGHTVDRVVSIMDANGLTLSLLTGFAQRLFRLIASMDSDNYPETCDAIYIVNAGATFGAIWRIVAPFVDKGTRDKVHVVGNAKASQQTLIAALGRARVPTFLGGELDYEAVKQQWYGKMDAAMAELHAHPRGHQLRPVVLQLSSSNGHAAPSVSEQGGAHAATAARGSFSGMFGHLPHLGGISTSRIDRHSVDSRKSDNTDGFATPQSGASRFSAASGASVYFDAVDVDPTAAAGAAGAAAPAQHDGVGAASTSSSTAGGGTAGVHIAASGPAHALDGASSGGVYGGGPASTPGSMSVGPHSCTRSQLSGFTAGGGGGQQGSAGGPGATPGGGHDDEALGGGHFEDGKQPRCRCVIS